MNYKIITIGRQFGSGGHEIGESLSQQTGIDLYDEHLIKLALDYGDLSSSKELKEGDEQCPKSLLYTIFKETNAKTGYHIPAEDAMYNLQSQVITELANEGPCIIIGRCADYILKGRTDVLSIFIYASKEYRIKRIMNCYHLDEKEALSLITKKDKQRSSYYNYYTDKKWGYKDSYSLTLNSSKLSIETCTDILKSQL